MKSRHLGNTGSGSQGQAWLWFLATATPELRAVRYWRYCLRSDQLRQPRLPAHNAGVAVQHAEEQRHALSLRSNFGRLSSTLLENVNVASMFGETAGIKIALNTNNPSASLTGWQTATVPMNSNASTYLAGQQLGSSRMSQLAMIETSDGRSRLTVSRLRG